MSDAKFQVQFENIPDELKAIPQWVMWKNMIKKGEKKPSKVPFNPNTGKMAKVSDPNTWGTFDKVEEKYNTGKYSGVGIVLTETDNIVGPDFDNCLDEGKPKDWAVEPLTMINTYTEISPSETGIRQIAFGKKPGDVCKAIVTDKTETMPKEEAIEFYGHGRYLTITGNIWPGAPRTVNHDQSGIDALYAHMEKVQTEYTNKKKKKPRTPAENRPHVPYVSSAADDVTKAENALQRLSAWRIDDYKAWVSVGMALSGAGLGVTGLGMWKTWSRGSAKHADGVCDKKWASFNRSDGYNLGSLINWAKEDNPGSAADVVARIKEIAGSEVLDAFNVASADLGPFIGYIPRKEHPAIIESLVSDLDVTKTDAKSFVRGCVADAKKERAEEKKKIRAAKAEEKLSADRTIDIADKQFRDIYEEARVLLVRKITENPTNPSIYVRGGALAKVKKDENKNHSINLLGYGDLQLLLSAVANWVRSSKTIDGVKVYDEMPHLPTIRSMLDVGNIPGVPGIDGIVTAPVFGPEGHLHTEPGYDAETRLYFAKNGLEIGDTSPTPKNVAAAKKLILDDLLADFPFQDDASKAHAVALLLVGFVRPMIDGPTPLHLIDSPTPGTGKGLLASACTMPAMGPNLPSTSAGRDDDEWRKRLTSALIAGSNVCNLDNLTEKLDSGVLASAITQPVWEDRILGSSHTVRVKIRNIWIATGNNTALSQEISRRCIWIRLDSNMEKPWEREGFTHPDLLSWASGKRGDLATAAITLIRAWVEKGKPDFKGMVKGSFSSWSNVIGGILETVEIPGFLSNEAALYDKTVEGTSALVEFIKTWAKTYPDEKREIDVRDLFKLASYPDDLTTFDATVWLGLLDEELGAGNQRSRSSKFGRLLTKNCDKVVAGYKILSGTPNRNGSTYKLINVAKAREAAEEARKADEAAKEAEAASKDVPDAWFVFNNPQYSDLGA